MASHPAGSRRLDSRPHLLHLPIPSVMVGGGGHLEPLYSAVAIAIMLMLLYDGIMVVIVAVVVAVVNVLVVIMAVVAARRRPCSLHEVKL